MRKIFFTSNRLMTQMIGRFVLIVVLAATIAGLPGIIIIRNELDKRAWTRVEQGLTNTKTLYAARQNELIAFAKLVSHRECLHEGIMANDVDAVMLHLQALIAETDVPLLLVCTTQKEVMASTMDFPSGDICNDVNEKGVVVIEGNEGPELWITGSHQIGGHMIGHDLTTTDLEIAGWAIAGVKVEDVLAGTSWESGGMEYTVYVGDQPISSSLNMDITNADETLYIDQTRMTEEQEEYRQTFEYQGKTYFAVRQHLDDPSADLEISLSVDDILATQKGLIQMLLLSTALVILLGSIAGIFFAQQINRPLQKLTQTAVVFSNGDLSTPVKIQANLEEVDLVAEALEGARSKLLQSMTQLSAEKAWSSHLLESIVEGIMTLDGEGRIRFFSRGAEIITGWNRDQVLFKHCDQVFHLPENGGPFSRFIPPHGSQSKVVVEVADGRYASLAITGTILAPSEGGEIETALVFRDVSHEEVIHQRLGNFMSNIAHEFRTPLAALAASVELLLEPSAESSDPAEMRELLTSLHLGISRLQTLIDNLIESASIEAGHFRVSPHPQDIRKIIYEAVATMNPLIEKYGQQLSVDVPKDLPPVWADGRRTVQVLVNLLSNANKYSPPNAEIQIRTVKKNGYLRIEVIDQGPGITAEERDYLFRRFKYLSDKNDNKAGAGLGLPVVKAIVEAQGGQAGMDDNGEKGSRFWFTVRMAGEA